MSIAARALALLSKNEFEAESTGPRKSKTPMLERLAKVARTLLLPAAAATMLAACDARTLEYEVDTSKLTYQYDARTKLCFASAGRGTGGLFGFFGKADSFSMTNVPCTDEVQKLAGIKR